MTNFTANIDTLKRYTAFCGNSNNYSVDNRIKTDVGSLLSIKARKEFFADFHTLFNNSYLT